MGSARRRRLCHSGAMAIVHRAELKPAKLDLISAWLPTQDWFRDSGHVEREATFRLDDPAGEVGIETFIVRAGESLFHVPLTYRDAPLEGGRLVGELEHSVLGHRWVYDGPSDPVYTATTKAAIVSGAHEVELYFADGQHVPRPAWAASVTGSGLPEDAEAWDLVIARLLPAAVPHGAQTLDASWAGLEGTLALAWLE